MPKTTDEGLVGAQRLRDGREACAVGLHETRAARLSVRETRLSLDTADLEALLALISARTQDDASHAAARLRGLLGPDAALFEPHVEAVFERQREWHTARRLAATDPLTSAANRRAFADGLRRELSRAARSSMPVAVLLLDLDDLKAINDTLGHAEGDRALRVVASCARHVTRELDLVARIGGDEFAVLLPETSEAEARAVVDRIRAEIVRRRGSLPVRVSVGLACALAGAPGASALLAIADRALYRDKASRRSQRGRSDASGAISIGGDHHDPATRRRASAA